MTTARRVIWCGAIVVGHLSSSGVAHQNSKSPSDARWRAEIHTVERALPRIPDRGAALFLLAKRYAQVGEPQSALALLQECMALGEGFDPGEVAALQSLASDPAFRELVAKFRRAPVHRARIAFTIPEPDLFPEGMAVDSGTHVFYMGSIFHKKIVRMTEAGEVSDFVRPGLYQLQGFNGIKVDPRDRGLWAATTNGHESELVHFDALGKLLERFRAPGEGPTALNDLVLHNVAGNTGEIYVTDALAHQVYRFDLEQHRFSPLEFPRPVFYPNGIALSDDGNLLYVADSMGVIQVDLRNNATREVEPGSHNSLSGFDGLYWYKNSLVAVQYGTGPYRVVRERLSSNGLRVASAEVLEYHTSLLSFPTTGAILGGRFYFIANAGIANLKDDDTVADPAKLEPIHIGVVSLDK